MNAPPARSSRVPSPLPRWILPLALVAALLGVPASAQGPADLAGDPTDAELAPFYPGALQVLDGRLYFQGSRQSRLSGEYWTLDDNGDPSKVFETLPRKVLGNAYGTTPLVHMGGYLYTISCDDIPRCRLWKSDGSGGVGKVLFEEEPYGEWYLSRGLPLALVAGEGRLYFSLPTRRYGYSLWTSDGTIRGTRLLQRSLKDIAIFPRTLLDGDRVVMRVGDTLWASDGTARGTHYVKAFRDQTIREVVSSGPLAYVVLDERLWVSDGTRPGTRGVKLHHLRVSRLVPTGDGRCFVFSSSNGHSLWITDGSAAGTRLLSRRRYDAVGGALVGETLYYAGRGGNVLARLDGDTVTELFDAGSRIDEIVPSADVLYLLTFNSYLGSDSVRRWPLGGTEGAEEVGSPTTIYDVAGFGGALAADTHSGLHFATADATELTPVQRVQPVSTSPRRLTATGHGDDLLFTRPQPLSDELYLARDGAVQLLTEVSSSVLGADIVLSRAGGRLFVISSKQLQVFDEEAGTLQPVLSTETVDALPFPNSVVEYDGQLYFFSRGDGYGVWRSDGETTSIVHPVEKNKDISSRDLGCHSAVAAGDTLYFFVAEQLLASKDGAAPMVLPVGHDDEDPCLPSAVLDGMLFFIKTVPTETVENVELVTQLYRSDGTADGTVVLQELHRRGRGRFSGYRGELASFGDRLFFLAEDLEHGMELWTSDGSDTTLFLDLYPGRKSSSPGDLTVVGDRLFFTAEDRRSGREIWMSDGTPQGTVRMTDIAPGRRSSFPSFLAGVDGHLLFAATDGGEEGLELWTSDGTAAGTRRLQDIQPGPFSSHPGRFVAAGDSIYFEAWTEKDGFELWRMPRSVLPDTLPQ